MLKTLGLFKSEALCCIIDYYFLYLFFITNLPNNEEDSIKMVAKSIHIIFIW